MTSKYVTAITVIFQRLSGSLKGISKYLFLSLEITKHFINMEMLNETQQLYCLSGYICHWTSYKNNSFKNIKWKQEP